MVVDVVHREPDGVPAAGGAEPERVGAGEPQTPYSNEWELDRTCEEGKWFATAKDLGLFDLLSLSLPERSVPCRAGATLHFC